MEKDVVINYNTFVEYALNLLKGANILNDDASCINFSVDGEEKIFCPLYLDRDYDVDMVESKHHELLSYVNHWKEIIDLLNRVQEFKNTPSLMSNKEAEIFKLENNIYDNFYNIKDLTEYEEEYSKLVVILQQLDVIYGENKE